MTLWVFTNVIHSTPWSPFPLFHAEIARLLPFDSAEKIPQEFQGKHPLCVSSSVKGSVLFFFGRNQQLTIENPGGKQGYLIAAPADKFRQASEGSHVLALSQFQNVLYVFVLCTHRRVHIQTHEGRQTWFAFKKTAVECCDGHCGT